MKVERLTSEAIHAVYALHDREIAPEHAAALEQAHGYALADAGVPFAVGGIYQLRPGVGMVWTMMGRQWRRWARVITAFCIAEIEKAPFERLEAATLAGWGPGQSWLERMGFSVETPCARRWDGVSDYTLFARLRDG